MASKDNLELDDTNTMKVEGEPDSARAVLDALDGAKDYFREWNDLCDGIDQIYSRTGSTSGGSALFGNTGWTDGELDIFWSSIEVIKPAIYAHVPNPVVAPMFKDNSPVKIKTADILERATSSSFELSDADRAFQLIRDDLIFTNRGVLWARYESEGKGQRVCFEFLDRMDFLHEPGRYWHEIGWVARRAWMTLDEMEARFSEHSGDAYKTANLTTSRGKREDRRTHKAEGKKASVWEVWHKADNRVYWVAEGVDVFLDQGKPHLNLNGFFPCPEPAYGTKERRSLLPVPDYTRYAVHFDKINTLTSRIYMLLDRVKLRGIISGSTDVRSAIEQLISEDDDQLLVSIPSITADMQSSLVWLPLREVAETITGLIGARTQLIEDYYQLSGISDIMRGATEAQETLGAQELKSQYGSVRIRQKANEICRLARDAIRIAAEIIAENFTRENILEMTQLDLPTKAEIRKKIDGIERAAERELKELEAEVREAAQGGNIPPEAAGQAQQEFMARQQEIMQRHGKDMADAQNAVTIEEVMDLLRDGRARHFSFEVEDGSTVWADEQAEKSSRNEYMGAFNAAVQSLAPLATSSPAGADLAGAMMKFQLAPYRAGRELNAMIDAWVDGMKNAPPPGVGESEEMAQATAKLAEAEMQKARAQMANVEANAKLKQAEMMARMQEMQQKAEKDRNEGMIKVAKLQADATENERQFAAKIEELNAKTDLMRAQTAEILSKIGLDVRKQEVEEYKAASGEQRAMAQEARADRSEVRAQIEGPANV